MPSNNLLAQINSEEFTSILHPLLTLTVRTGPAGGPYENKVLRYVKNFKDVVSRGDTYEAGSFDLFAPAAGGDTPPSVSITADLADIDLVAELRLAFFRPIVKLEYVLHDTPDLVEFGPFEFQTSSIDFSGTNIKANLEYEPVLQQTVPKDFITPTLFPGGF